MRWCDDIEGHYVVSPSRILFDVLGFGGARSLWDPEDCEEGGPCSELIGCDLALVKQHMEYQRLQEFHQSVRDRSGTNACAVCFLPGSKRCSQCKSVSCGIAAVAVSPHIGRGIRVAGVSSLTPTFSVS